MVLVTNFARAFLTRYPRLPATDVRIIQAFTSVRKVGEQDNENCPEEDKEKVREYKEMPKIDFWGIFRVFYCQKSLNPPQRQYKYAKNMFLGNFWRNFRRFINESK